MIDDDEPESLDQPEDPGAEPIEFGEPRQNKRETRINREERESREFWGAVLNNPIGRRELWRLFCGPSGAHAFETRFSTGPAGFPDQFAKEYERGVQDFGLRTYQFWIGVDPAAVIKMHQECDSRMQKPDRHPGRSKEK